MGCVGRVAFLVALLGTTETATAQLRSTVQLPTFQQFSMTTTVVVPDRGGVTAGGVSRSWQASSRRGLAFIPHVHRSLDWGSGAEGVSVLATVHDLEEMDRLVLSRWATIKQQKRASIPHFGIASVPAGQPRISIQELRNRVDAEEREDLAKAIADFQAGLRWEEKGRQPLAKLYFQRALRQGGNDELQEKIAARLRLVNRTAKTARSQNSRRLTLHCLGPFENNSK